MRVNILLTLLVFWQCVYTSSTANENTEEFSLLDSELSLKYQRGEFLIYDCVDEHWVCSAEPEFNRCKHERDFALKERNRELPCIPVQKFISEAVCQKTQVRLVDENRYKQDCFQKIED